MRRIVLPGAAGVVLWFGMALAAEAQGITPTGPLHVYSNDATVTYTATVTTNYSFWAFLSITDNGTQVAGGQWFCVNSGPSFPFTSPSYNTSSWSLAKDQKINFHFVVQFSPVYRWISDYSRTVEDPPSTPPTSMAPEDESKSSLFAALPVRKDDDVLGEQKGDLA